jgi:uncharacterized protein (TIGR02246 family)
MKRAVIGLAVLSLGIVLLAVASHHEGDPAAEVVAASQAALTAWNTGDVEAFMPHFHPDGDNFYLTGGPLVGAPTAEGMQAGYDAGFKPDVTPRDVQVKVYGGDTAILTCYLEGTVTDEDGSVSEGPWRFSEVRVKSDDGMWLIAHAHFSSLTAVADVEQADSAPE